MSKTQKRPAKETKRSKGTAADKKSTAATEQKQRRVKKPQYKSFRLHKKIKKPIYHLPSSWRLLKRAIGTIYRRPKLFLGITLVYLVLSFLLVHGGLLNTSGLSDLKDLFAEQFPDASGQVATAAGLFLYLVGTSTSSDGSGNVYQMVLLLTVSLALIWALRQAYASKLAQKIRIRDSFYRGMSPLVPFVLVFLVILIELVPMAIGSFLYSTVMQNGIAVEFIEKLLWAIFFGLTIILSVYLVMSTMFALYVVALPDMTPMRALRSSRSLVRYRRLSILRKIIVYVIFICVILALLMIPIILFAVTIAEVSFFVLTTLALTLSHSYFYALYRELLNE